MGYFQNLEIAEQVEVGDRSRRSTYRRPTQIVVVNRKLFYTMIAVVWFQFLATTGLIVVVFTR